MIIGITSDTHGCFKSWQNIYGKYFGHTGLIIHAGDILYHGPRNGLPAGYNPSRLARALNECPIPIVAAGGNCDAEVDSLVLDFPVQAPYAYILLNGRRVLVNHGHKLSQPETRAIAARFKADIFITGHTHIASLTKTGPTIYLNPGSPVPDLSKRADGKGTLAMIKNRQVAVLDAGSGEVLAVETIPDYYE